LHVPCVSSSLSVAQYSDVFHADPELFPPRVEYRHPPPPTLSMVVLSESIHIASTVISFPRTVDSCDQTDILPPPVLEVSRSVAAFGIGELESSSGRSQHVLPPYLPPYRFSQLRSEISAIWTDKYSKGLCDGCDDAGNSVFDPDIASVCPVSRYDQLYGKSLLPFVPPARAGKLQTSSQPFYDLPKPSRSFGRAQPPHSSPVVPINQVESRSFATLTTSLAEMQAENAILKRRLEAANAELQQVW
jgi:hypothetical protein